MTKEEYNEIVSQTMREITQKKKFLIELGKKYIEEHKPFKEGQKVSLYDSKQKKTVYAFVGEFHEVCGEIYPRLYKMTKDGRMSKHHLHLEWVEDYDSIQPVD